jgi:CubicO group peptidase (beta-lactamase class C family)
MIIEKITGKTFAQEVTSRILVPLGLKNTLVPETPDMPAGSTHGYTWDSKWVDTTRIETSWASSAGNMISDSADLLVWLKALMQGTLLDKKTKEEMFTFVDIAPNMGYGLGLEKQGESIGHTGDIVFGGQAAMYQLKGWQLVVLVNSSPSKPAAAPFGSEYIMAKVIVALGLVQ